LSKRIFNKATSVDEEALEQANFLILSPFGEVTTRDGEQQFEVVTPFEAETWSIVAGYADRPTKCCADFERREDAICALGAVGGSRPCWYADSSEQFQINDFAVLASRISGPRVYVISATDIQWDTDGKRVRGLPKQIKFQIELGDDEDESEIEEKVCDWLSDQYDWCVAGCEFESALVQG
jgi:hypothetical protein